MPTTRLPLTIVATPTEEAALVSALRLALAVSEVGDARKGARGVPLSRVQREAVRRILARGVARRRRTREELTQTREEAAMSEDTSKDTSKGRIKARTVWYCGVCGEAWDTKEEALAHDVQKRASEKVAMAAEEARTGPYLGMELPVYQHRRYPTPEDELVLRGKRKVTLVELKRVGHGVMLVVEPGVPVLVPCSYDSEYTVELETRLSYWRIEGGKLWLANYSKDYADLECRVEEWEATGKLW